MPTVTVSSSDPMVLAWSLALSSGQVVIQFDQVVNPATFKVSRVSFINAPQRSYPFDTAVYLTGYVKSSFMNLDILGKEGLTNSTSYGGALTPTPIVFFMTADDYAAMMYNSATCNGPTSTYLVIRQGAVSTFAGRPSQEINQTVALQVQTFAEDTDRPYVVSAGLDYDRGFITLVFSKPIGEGTVPTGIVSMQGLMVQSAASCAQSGPQLFCKGAIIFTQQSDAYQVNVSSYARTITYFIGRANVNAIKVSASSSG